jgi:oligopeptide/dipeptide ABC transporter ATP-binding protein
VLLLFDDLRVRLNLAMLFISHDLNVVRLLCSRVMVMYLGVIVEEGPAEVLFDRPLHPYTQALVAAIPDAARRGMAAATQRLQGDIPSAIDPPPNACRFAGRCPHVVARCSGEMPVLRDVGGGRRVACHLVEAEAA